MKVWISQYALAPKGLIEVDVVRIDSNGHLFAAQGPWTYSVQPENWHRSHADAVNRAEQMRADRIVELNKEIARLNALMFGQAVQPSNSGGET